MSLFTPESRSGWPPSAAQSEYKSCGSLVDRADLTTCRGGFDLVVDSGSVFVTCALWSLVIASLLCHSILRVQLYVMGM